MKPATATSCSGKAVCVPKREYGRTAGTGYASSPSGHVVSVDVPIELENARFMSTPAATSQGVAIVANFESSRELVTVDLFGSNTTRHPLSSGADDLLFMQLSAGKAGFGVLHRPYEQRGGLARYLSVLDPVTLAPSAPVDFGASAGVGADPRPRTGTVVLASSGGSIVAWWFGQDGTQINAEPIVLLEKEYLGTNY